MELAGKLEKARLELLDRFPGQLQYAQAHRRANKFGKPDPSSLQVCSCCSQRIANQPFPYCTSTSDPQLPSDIALYFLFIKLTMGFLILKLAMCDLYDLYSNWSGNDCRKLPGCPPDPLTLISVANKYNHSSTILQLDTMHLLGIFIYCGYFLFMRFLQYGEYVRHDIGEYTQDDYALFVRNIPKVMEDGRCDYEKRLKERLQEVVGRWLSNGQQGADGSRLWRSYEIARGMEENGGARAGEEIVVRVDLCWDLSRLERMMELREGVKRRREEVVQKILEIQHSQDPTDPQQLSNLQRQQRQLLHKLNMATSCTVSVCSQYASDTSNLAFCASHFTGKAFVTFQYQQFAYAVSRQYAYQPIELDGYQLQILPANHPRDINYDNLRITDSERRVRKLTSFALTAGGLVLVFAVLLGLSLVKEMVDQAKHAQGHVETGKQKHKRLEWLYPILLSLVIVAVNEVLQGIRRKLTVHQQHETQTEHQMSFMIKLLLSQFANTALINCVVAIIIPKRLWVTQGLIPKALSLLTISSLIKVILNFINIPLIMKWLKFTLKYRKNPLPSGTYPTHQDLLNKQLQPPQFQLATRYTFYILQVWTLSFFSYLIPSGSLIMLFIFLLSYHVDKYNLFRQCSLKNNFEYELSRVAIKLLESSLFVFAVGNCVFGFVVVGRVGLMNWMALGFTTLFMGYLWAMPKRVEYRLLDSYQEFQERSYEYCRRTNQFEQTYRNQNPATKFSSTTIAKRAGQWQGLDPKLIAAIATDNA